MKSQKSRPPEITAAFASAHRPNVHINKQRLLNHFLHNKDSLKQDRAKKILNSIRERAYKQKPTEE